MVDENFMSIKFEIYIKKTTNFYVNTVYQP